MVATALLFLLVTPAWSPSRRGIDGDAVTFYMEPSDRDSYFGALTSTMEVNAVSYSTLASRVGLGNGRTVVIAVFTIYMPHGTGAHAKDLSWRVYPSANAYEVTAHCPAAPREGGDVQRIAITKDTVAPLTLQPCGLSSKNPDQPDRLYMALTMYVHGFATRYDRQGDVEVASNELVWEPPPGRYWAMEELAGASAPLVTPTSFDLQPDGPTRVELATCPSCAALRAFPPAEEVRNLENVVTGSPVHTNTLAWTSVSQPWSTLIAWRTWLFVGLVGELLVVALTPLFRRRRASGAAGGTGG